MSEHECPVISHDWFYRLTEEERKQVIAAAVRMFKKTYKE